MNDAIKWTLKVALQGVLWVFLLSITVSGRTVFEHAHGALVQNVLVQTLDEELGDLWTKLSRTAELTFSESEAVSEDKSL
jgi:hypothetical protein